MRTFTCEDCGGTFTDGWTEDEARKEADALWSVEELNRDGEAIICDDCFQELMIRLGRGERGRTFPN